jgi:hypothetical protein
LPSEEVGAIGVTVEVRIGVSAEGLAGLPKGAASNRDGIQHVVSVVLFASFVPFFKTSFLIPVGFSRNARRRELRRSPALTVSTDKHSITLD